MSWVIAAAIAGAYFFVGFRLVAPAYVTRKVQDDAERYPNLAKDPAYVAQERRMAAVESIGVALVWPIYLTGRALISGIADRAPLSEHELRQQLRDREDRIAELERDLDLGRDP